MPFGDMEFERRIFPRFTLHLPFVYVLDDRKTGQGMSTNASQGGMLVYLPEKVQPEDRLRLKLTLTDKEKPRQIEIVVRVVWVRENTDGGPQGYKVGFEFEEITPEASMYLKSFEQVWLE